MDALQVVSAATQIVSSMVGAVGALEEASRNLDEAPKRIRSLEEFVFELENLTRRVKQKHAYKLHNPQLDHQIQSLNGLIERLHPNIRKARKITTRNKIKNLAKVVWSSVVGDPLLKLVISMRNDLNWWLESQKLAENVEKVIDSTAENTPVQLRINSEQGYPISNKCHFVRSLLEKEGSHRVVLIVGLSGIGKSCLARQVASDPPLKFIHGAVELGFGQWCSRAACNGSKAEYQKRLARKICKFLVQIGFWKKIRDENSGDLEYVCCLLQEALFAKSMLVLLDDVWEQDIVERFTKLYDNGCRFLVTTRNEAVYEITEAEKAEISKEDAREISKTILLYHSLLKEDELPSVADNLLERCGHHPLTVAVMGKALRKETRAEKWEKAIINISTYAECAPGPISYVNEKEVENTLTIFGSFEFSLEAMTEHSRRLFIALAALSWVESMPEACLEALWSVLGQESLFPLIVCKLVEGSLLMKVDSYPMYQVHDMVSLYLDGKTNDAIHILLTESSPEDVASITPWFLVFGKETVKTIAEQRMKSFLNGSEENQAVITLNSIVQALMASKSISELEASRVSFSNLLGPRVADLISVGSPGLIAGCANAITNIFSKSDFSDYTRSLETVGAVNKLADVLENCEDPMIQTNISTVLAKLAENGNSETIEKVLQSIPINRLADLLTPNAEEWHESVFATLMSLIKAGQSRAVEKMFASGVDKNLIRLLENGSEVAQHHAIVTLKAFYELGGPLANRSIRPGTLNLLPWHARLSLEKFVLSDRNVPASPKPQTFEDLIEKILDRDQKRALEAMQDIISIIEKAGEPRICDMIIQSPLIGRLAELLRHGQSERNSTRSQSAFLLMKLACSGGEPCIRKFLEYDIVPELVKMMQCNIGELQDSAYTTLHQMLFGQGGQLVMNLIIQNGFLDKLVHSIESKSIKTREVCVNCILDLVEVGNKACIERIFSLQVVEKLAKLEKISGGSGEFVVRFLKGMNKCKHLSVAERRVMKQQVVRKARAVIKGHKFEAQIIAAIEACISEGSRGASSSKQK
ncbi:Disease resistance protein [Macleaya cordata]|uniref:Disease resistance protein n=1 Tax=Macleaya cordata TaxID=56857 RepID=A0A200PQH5_MACCD|nr:Disease resistance protein [Macleaya cordata]